LGFCAQGIWQASISHDREETLAMAYGFHSRGISLIGLIYIIVGVFIAWDRGYINVDLVRKFASALLAIFLWFLVLLGVDLHIHA
jgi:hypothetical protein